MAGQKNFGLLGMRKSTPKMTRINGDDNQKAIYRNMGNNHAYPMVWAGTVTVASGVSVATIASGIKFHGYDAATYATVSVTPNWNAGAVYVTKDIAANTIIATTANAGANDGSSAIDIMVMLGADADVEGFNCRGFGTLPLPSY